MSPCKIYTHLDAAGLPSFCLPIDVARPEDMQFGTVKQAFLGRYGEQFPDEATLDYNEYCFWNQEHCPIPDHSPIAVYSWEHNDFFLRPLPAGAAGRGGELAANREKRGELSYYYAHDRQKQSLVSRPQSMAVSAANETEKRQPLKASAAAAGSSKFNNRQSPFGTDITGYETITSYTWEDHSDDTVKVLIPLDGVGKLEKDKVRSSFGPRGFELLVEGYNGKNLRFACSKTHSEITPEECKHVVRANRVNLVLRKAKEKDIWFDLFKKRAIGDDEEP
mmetsp:Transcript_73969/g.128339  ORF Transcript_73969/g.128339 Transcript_73969/m.128339 type:complete len:278 (+) Transcript_73969:102-935(+)